MPEQNWLPTTQAALSLGVSPQHLKKCRTGYEDGFLVEEEHSVFGRNANSSIPFQSINSLTNFWSELCLQTRKRSSLVGWNSLGAFT